MYEGFYGLEYVCGRVVKKAPEASHNPGVSAAPEAFWDIGRLAVIKREAHDDEP
jgi:hypothetical protein